MTTCSDCFTMGALMGACITAALGFAGFIVWHLGRPRPQAPLDADDSDSYVVERWLQDQNRKP